MIRFLSTVTPSSLYAEGQPVQAHVLKKASGPLSGSNGQPETLSTMPIKQQTQALMIDKPGQALGFGRQLNTPAFGQRPGAGLFYRIADGFLTMHQRVAAALSGKKGTGANVGRWVANNLLDHDYRAQVGVPLIGRLFIEPPMGALSFYIMPAVFVTRTYNAIKRAVNNDYREVRDIMIRDIPSMTVLVYAQPYLVKRLTSWAEKVRGLKLLDSHGEPMSFDMLADVYDMRHSNQFKRALHEPLNKKGMLNTIEGYLKTPALRNNDKFIPYLKQLKTHVQQGFQIAASPGYDPAKSSPAMDKVVQQGFGIIQRLEQNRQRLLRQTEQSTAGYLNRLLKRWTTRSVAEMDGIIPSFTKMWSSRALNGRVVVTATAMAQIIAVLGIAIPAFNKIFTDIEYRRLKERADQWKNQQIQELMHAGKPSVARKVKATVGLAPTPFPHLNQKLPIN